MKSCQSEKRRMIFAFGGRGHWPTATAEGEYLHSACQLGWLPILVSCTRPYDTGYFEGESCWQQLISTGWSNWILLQKLKYFICCLIDLLLFWVWHLSNSIWNRNTLISSVKSSWTSPYCRMNGRKIWLLINPAENFSTSTSSRELITD